MPGIDRRTVSGGLLLVGGVADQVVKQAVGGGGAEVDFVDGVADAVARVGGAVRVAGIRGRGHPDAKEADGDLVILSADPEKDVTAFSKVRYTIRGGKVIYSEK